MNNSLLKYWRHALTAILGVAFAASAFILNSNSANMQTASNTIVFDRYDEAVGKTKVFVMNVGGSTLARSIRKTQSGISNVADVKWKSFTSAAFCK